MDEPLLSNLCTICHIDPPKYTCPRCSAQTCSLACSKRHKIWSSCNGIRDPTVYKPMSELATPSGIDHDYNFIHSIETRISRSEKVLIEDLGIVDAKELERARLGLNEEEWKKRQKKNEPPGEVQITRCLTENKIKVIKAPKGMRRNQENTTSWNRKQKAVNWQVEWMRDPPKGRALYRIAGNRPIGEVYDILCDEERRMAMTDEEKRAEKKRKAEKARGAKRMKIEGGASSLSTIPILQDPRTTAWNCTIEHPVVEYDVEDEQPESNKRSYNLYLLRPLTPASFPKVLAPIDPAKPLTELLRDRDVLEFPTIHVLDTNPEDLPNTFMLEKSYLAAIGQKGRRMETDTEMSGMDGETEDSDDDTSSDSDSDTSSSSEEESDADMEDGEIV